MLKSLMDQLYNKFEQFNFTFIFNEKRLYY